MTVETSGLLSSSTRRDVGGVPMTVLPFSEAIDLVMRLAQQDGPVREVPTAGVAVHFCNAYNIALADAGPHYAECLRAGVAFSDGTPLTWAGRLLHPDVAASWDQVRGTDLMCAVLARSDRNGPRHYLVGGTEETLARLTARIHRDWPDAVVVGAESPPFREPTAEEFAARDERIVESGATMVWLGLGSPKQDFEARRLADSTGLCVLAVGAAFDFLAGTKRQAPEWVQRSGTEWLFRLVQEPRRLFVRYLWGNPRFVAATVRNRPAAAPALPQYPRPTVAQPSRRQPAPDRGSERWTPDDGSAGLA